MKLFTQLALVSAIAVSGNAMAMQALDDAQLASTTGQDGITLTIKPPVKAFSGLTAGAGGVIAIDSIYVHDKGGLAAAQGGTDTSGAITLDGFAIAGNAPIVVKIDADGNAANLGAGGAFLNVNVALPSELVIRTGNIGVARSNRVAGSATTVRGIVAGTKNAILDSIDVKLGGATMNIQLGNQVQAGSTGTGNTETMIKVAGSIANGLIISGVTLKDTVGTAASTTNLGTKDGQIKIGDIVVTDTANGAATAATTLTLATDIDVSTNGLVLTMGGGKNDVLLADVRLGDTTQASSSIGDVEIVGLDMIGAQIAVTGH